MRKKRDLELPPGKRQPKKNQENDGHLLQPRHCIRRREKSSYITNLGGEKRKGGGEYLLPFREELFHRILKDPCMKKEE